MIVAEELEVDLSSVRVEQAPGDSAYGKQATSGSSCIPETYRPLRMAGAKARVMLIAAAAQVWGVDEDSCYAESGTVVHEPTDRRLAYGELVETAASLPPGRAQLKDEEEFKLIGTRIGQLENPQIVDGSAVFGADIQLPGMLYATVARSPILRSKVTDFDPAKAEAIEGVRHIVPIDSGIAVVADNTWAAFQGSQALELSWEGGSYADLSSSALRQNMVEQAEARNSGAENMLESIYEISFLTHVTPSPMNATADVGEDSCEVWAPTQSPQLARSRVASITNLPYGAITVHVPRVGGGFGRRIKVDYVEEAAQISQAVGAPIKLTWTREDDIQHGFFHPLSVHHASVDLSQPAMPRVYSQTYQEWDRLTFAWRAVSNFTDAFVRECFLDEMAAALGRDPLEMRLELGPGSLRAVQELAASEAGWGASLPEGRSRGIAAFSTWGVAPVAMVAEVSVDNGTVRVHRVVCAIDCGTVINPDLVEAQMEGGVAWGLSALLNNQITIEEGRVQQSNFHD
jgi:CO/xanthine dehydrogenase Mo-binding subunit